MLEEHLKFIGKTSDRRKCSRSALAEANVDKRVAGKKGSTNKYRYCPISAGEKSTATPDDEAQSTSQPQTRWYSEIYRNNNRFVLRILPKEAKICKGWNNHFCHTSWPSSRAQGEVRFPPWRRLEEKKKRQTRRHRDFITLIQIVFNRDSPISITSGLHRNSTRSWSPSKWVSQAAFPCRCNDCTCGSKHHSYRMYKKLRSLLD